MDYRVSNSCMSLQADTLVLSPKTTDSLFGVKPSSAKKHSFFPKNWDLTNRLSLFPLEKSPLQLSMKTLISIPGALTMVRGNWEFWKVKLSPARTSTCPNWWRDLLLNKFLKFQSASTSCSPLDWIMISSAKLFKGTCIQSPSRQWRVIIKKLMKLLLQSSMRSKTEKKKDLCLHIIMTPLLTLSNKTIIHTLQTLWSNRKALLRGHLLTTQVATLKRLLLMVSLNLLTVNFKAAEKLHKSLKF